MNIKELFENERLYTASVIDSYEHNKCLDRIEASVNERIKAMEAQVPKRVKPKMNPARRGTYYLCSCHTVVDGIRRFNYCPDCGAKLDWEDK